MRKDKIRAAQNMQLINFLCEFFEDSSGIARMDIEDGSVWVNGKNITNSNEPIFNGDMVEKRYEKTTYKVTAELSSWRV